MCKGPLGCRGLVFAFSSPSFKACPEATLGGSSRDQEGERTEKTVVICLSRALLLPPGGHEWSILTQNPRQPENGNYNPPWK